MNASEIYKYYENRIDDIEDEETKKALYQRLEDLDTALVYIESDLDKAIEEQNDMKYPDYDYQAEADWFNYHERI